MLSLCGKADLWPKTQEGQHPLTGQHTANSRLSFL